MFNFEFKLQQQSLYVRCRYFRFPYLFRYLFRSCGNLHRSKCLECIRAEEHFLVTGKSRLCTSSMPSHQMRTRTSSIQHSDSGFQCYCHLETGNTEQSFSSLGCLWRNEDGNPLFGEDLFSLFCVSSHISCSSCYLSCLYMWKTEQQPAALTSSGPSAELDFPPFPQRLSKIAHYSLKTGAKEGPNLCSDFMSKHVFVRSQSS